MASSAVDVTPSPPLASPCLFFRVVGRLLKFVLHNVWVWVRWSQLAAKSEVAAVK